VTLRGARQSGKRSLLVRLRQQAREDGWRSCYLNFQNLDRAGFESPDALFLELARMTVDALDVDADPDAAWSPRRGAKRNWTRFMEREVLDPSTPMLLLFDEVDLAFENDACRFDLFSMLRVWHNRRSEDLEGRWKGLGLVIAHRSEPGDWIEDAVASRVGRRFKSSEVWIAMQVATAPVSTRSRPDTGLGTACPLSWSASSM